MSTAKVCFKLSLTVLCSTIDTVLLSVVIEVNLQFVVTKCLDAVGHLALDGNPPVTSEVKLFFEYLSTPQAADLFPNEVISSS